MGADSDTMKCFRHAAFALALVLAVAAGCDICASHCGASVGLPSQTCFTGYFSNCGWMSACRDDEKRTGCWDGDICYTTTRRRTRSSCCEISDDTVAIAIGVWTGISIGVAVFITCGIALCCCFCSSCPCARQNSQENQRAMAIVQPPPQSMQQAMVYAPGPHNPNPAMQMQQHMQMFQVVHPAGVSWRRSPDYSDRNTQFTGSPCSCRLH